MKCKLLVTVADKARKFVGTAKPVLKEAAPEILLVAGVVAGVAATVGACVATAKHLKDVTEQSKDLFVTIEENVKLKEEAGEEVKPEVIRQAKAVATVRTGMAYAKLYGPWAALGSLSYILIGLSHHILRSRLAAMVAAYQALDTAFKIYKANTKKVIDELSDGKFDTTLLETGVIDSVEKTEDGNVSVSFKTYKDKNGRDITVSPYATFFDQTTSNYYTPCHNNLYNKNYIKQREDYWNTRFQYERVVTLNDVLKDLGMDPTKAGMVVGWKYDETGEQSDNVIKLNVNEVEIVDDSGESYYKLLIDFNVDGCIYDRMEVEQ